jgi:excisionase family DNA binding protein
MDETLTLKEAVAFLKLSLEALRRKAKAGEIPGAKVGKCWVFLEKDLVEYIRSQYANPRRATRVATNQEVKSCHSFAETKAGGSISAHQAERELDALLKPKTG